jgi:hypothetical protein
VETVAIDEKTAKVIKAAVASERRRIAKRMRDIAASKDNWLSPDARRALRDAAKEIML